MKLRMDSLSNSSSSSTAASSESSSESESAPPPRAEMLSRSSLEVRAPSRASAEKEEGGNGGAWSSEEASLRLWIEEVAEAEAECEGDGDWEVRERFGAARWEEWPSIEGLKKTVRFWWSWLSWEIRVLQGRSTGEEGIFLPEHSGTEDDGGDKTLGLILVWACFGFEH